MEIISGSAGGLMAVFAVSGSVVFFSMQAHKRLLSDFIQKMESQFVQNSSGGVLRDGEPKKKVRFAGDTVAAKKIDWKKHLNPAGVCCRKIGQGLESMPRNWQVMYKGILQNRTNHMS